MTPSHYDEPRTDNERLFNLQYDYKNGDGDALGKMYKMLFVIAHKAINKSKRGQDFCSADREQKAQDAATYVIEQYITRPDFVITDSITGYLFLRVRKELNYARKCDRMLAFTDTLPEKPATRKSYEYIVTDGATGARVTYHSAAELYLNPIFRKLRKKHLAECIRNGTRWNGYKFELLEI